EREGIASASVQGAIVPIPVGAGGEQGRRRRDAAEARGQRESGGVQQRAGRLRSVENDVRMTFCASPQRREGLESRVGVGAPVEGKPSARALACLLPGHGEGAELRPTRILVG